MDYCKTDETEQTIPAPDALYLNLIQILQSLLTELRKCKCSFSMNSDCYFSLKKFLKDLIEGAGFRLLITRVDNLKSRILKSPIELKESQISNVRRGRKEYCYLEQLLTPLSELKENIPKLDHQFEKIHLTKSSFSRIYPRTRRS